MRKALDRLTVFACLVVLAACAATGTVAPETFNQRLAYAEGVHSAVLDATDSSLNAGTLSSVAAGNIAAQADTAQTLLTAAKTADAAGDPTTANSKLAVALTALQGLQDYLRAQGAKK